MKRLADILLSLAALLLLAACTDDADVYNTPAPSEGNLCVYVPVTREGYEQSRPKQPYIQCLCRRVQNQRFASLCLPRKGQRNIPFAGTSFARSQQHAR